MSTDFMKNLIDDLNEETEEKPTKAYVAGFAGGMILVALGTFALEGLLIAAVATSLGWGLSFMQGLGIAALFELVMLRLKNG